MIAVIPQSGERVNEPAFEYAETLAAAAAGRAVLIPMSVMGIDVSLKFSGGAKGKIQTTIDLIDSIRGDNCTWVDWPFGEAETTVQRHCRAVSAMRAVCTDAGSGGTMKFTMRAQ